MRIRKTKYIVNKIIKTLSTYKLFTPKTDQLLILLPSHSLKSLYQKSIQTGATFIPQQFVPVIPLLQKHILFKDIFETPLTVVRSEEETKLPFKLMKIFVFGGVSDVT